MKKAIKRLIKIIISIFIRPIFGFFIKRNSLKNVNKIIEEKNNIFFGYYNIKPWNKSETFMVALKTESTFLHGDNTSTAEIILIDLNSNKKKTIDKIHCWNTQQGCMLQWLGPDYESKIIYNDYVENKYVSKIYDIKKNKIDKIIDFPIYSVSSDGKFALSLDFSRLHLLRPGYGYANVECKNSDTLCPDDGALFRIDLITGKVDVLLKYTDLYNFEFREEMKNSFHKINHIVINPKNNRIMFLHRWINDNKKYTRLITCDIDGKNMYNLSDDDMVSHCCWKNENEILGFLRKKEYGNRYYLLKDKTQNYRIIWKNIKEDGHCTYDESGKYIISDTYPNLFGISKVLLGTEKNLSPKVIAKFYSPNKYNDEVRCDLHPRWNYSGNKVSVDSVNDNYKKIYIIDIKGETDEEK